MARSQAKTQAARNAAVVALAARQLDSLWPRVDWASDRAIDAVTTLYRAIVTQGGRSAAALAAQQYDALRTQHPLQSNYRATVADPVSDSHLTTIVTSAFLGSHVTTYETDDDNSPSPITTSELPTERRVPHRLEHSLSRLVLQPGRDTIAHNAAKDPAKPTWIRVPVGETTCAFCILLASRELGPHFAGYRSRANALFRDNGEKYHKECDCEAIAVFDPARLRELSPDIDAHQDLYYKATAAAGTHSDTKKILREMRRLINAQQPPPEPAPPTPTPPRPRVDLEVPTPKTPQSAVPATTGRPADDPLPTVRVKPDLTTDPGADLAATNPNFGSARQWQINCTRCATTVELRARGYDVTAQPRPETVKDNGYQSILDRWISPDGSLAGQGAGASAVRDPAPGETVGMSTGSRVWHRLPFGRAEGRAAADDAAREWGDGARGYVTVTWPGGSLSHIFNVENRDGTIVYTDGQTNSIDASKHWDRMSDENSARIVRVDDLTPTARVMEWARERTDTEITTPSDADIQAEAVRRGFGSISTDARAFTAGAKAALAGDRPNRKYSGFKETQRSYDQGVTWARKPLAGDPAAQTARGQAGEGDSIDAPEQGSVDRSRAPKGLHQHELDTAHRLAARGHHVEFIPQSNVEGVKTPDILLDGVPTEMKTLTTSSANTVQKHLYTAQEQSRRVVLDMTNSPLSDDQVKSLVEQYGRRYHLLDVQVIRDAGGVDWRWTPDAGQ